MAAPVEQLSPRPVWREFAELCKIPRCSGNEEQVREYVISRAKSLGLEYKTDAAGNIVIRKEPHKTKREASPVIIQAHIDMVCEKTPGSTHDFLKDPVCPVVNGEWLYADNTTLGADNGIGAAYGLAVLADPEMIHGPLELLLTVNEETGLIGASNLDASMLTGKKLINIDSEEEGIFYIGCAGGKDTNCIFPSMFASSVSDCPSYCLRISGLAGGHSGTDIDKKRGSALKIGARILAAINASETIQICSITAPGRHNVISRDFSCSFFAAKLENGKYNSIRNTIISEYLKYEPGLCIELNEAFASEKPMTSRFSSGIITFLHLLPHGVLAMNPEIPGLVETSTNTAAVIMERDTIKVITSQRSSVDSVRDEESGRICSLARIFGGKTETNNVYPGWEPDLESPLLREAVTVYESIKGTRPEIKAIHAGLECGVLKKKKPDLDLISFGPDIQGAHSPSERVSIQSVSRVWDYLAALLQQIT